MLVSSVVAFELWYGVAKSERTDANTQRLLAFFAGPLESTLFDEDDEREAGPCAPSSRSPEGRSAHTTC